MELEVIPDKCMVGIFIPIHKPGKSRDSPDSYRPVILVSSSINSSKGFSSQDYKTRQLQRTRFSRTPNKMHIKNIWDCSQYHLTCKKLLLTILNWTQDTYVASLDTSKAFDHVWLYDFGISGKTWRLIIASYRNLSTYVLVNGVKSQTFVVKQGVRQGGVTSTWYYLLFISGLLQEWPDSGTCCTIGSIRLGNPTSADDLVLIGPSLKSLEKALSIVYEYSRKWRYLFNPEKCHLIIFSPRKSLSSVTVIFGPSQKSNRENQLPTLV